MAVAQKLDSIAIVDYIVNSRFYIYQRPSDQKWNLYENMYEEGNEVRKRVGVFETNSEAKEKLHEEQEKFRAELLQFVTIVDVKE